MMPANCNHTGVSNTRSVSPYACARAVARSSSRNTGPEESSLRSGPPPWDRGVGRGMLDALRGGALVILILCGGLLGLGSGCRPPPPGVEHPVWRDGAMGTAYMVRLAGVTLERDEYERVRREIGMILEEIEDAMSNWRQESEISRFNSFPPDTWFPVSGPLAEVLEETDWVSRQSGGAFDPTVAPLAALWGFGPGAEGGDPPSEEDIAAVRQRVGWHHVQWREEPPALMKTVAGVTIDLGGVAKGYAVDRVADFLRDAGYEHFLVEVGGEIRAQGTNANGDPWRVGVDMPLADAFPGESLAGVVHLTDGALATSGDYRRFVLDADGVPLAHILDPRTGRPVQRPASSVTVWAATSMRADSLSTAFYVLGMEQGLALAESIDGVEALFILRGADGSFTHYPSTGFIEATLYRASE